MARPSFDDVLEEDKKIEAAQTPGAATGVAPSKRIPKPTGRPKTKPESRQVSLHLPVSLIEKVEKEANAVALGNKSGLIVKILEGYFAKKG